MANGIKISGLTFTNRVSTNSRFPIVQDSTTFSTDVSSLGIAAQDLTLADVTSLGNTTEDPIIVDGLSAGKLLWVGEDYGNQIKNRNLNNIATILGGAGNTIQSGRGGAVIVSGLNNALSGNFDDNNLTSTFIGAGSGNVINCNGQFSSIVGGMSNTLSSGYGFLGGGKNNKIYEESASSIVGGNSNSLSSLYGFIGGGSSNRIKGDESIIVGGCSNSLSGDNSMIGGGKLNSLSSNSGFIGSGCNNSINESYVGFIGSGRCNRLIGGGGGAVVGGYLNQIHSTGTGTSNSFIGGGRCNTVSQSAAGINENVLVGGFGNNLSGVKNFIGGGSFHKIMGVDNFIGGGSSNDIYLHCANGQSVIVGGRNHCIKNLAQRAFIGGGSNNYICDTARFTPIIVGGSDNKITSGDHNNILGGCLNKILGGDNGNVLGGCCNTIFTGDDSSIVGGCNNKICHNNSFILGSGITSTKDNTLFTTNISAASISATEIIIGDNGNPIGLSTTLTAGNMKLDICNGLITAATDITDVLGV